MYKLRVSNSSSSPHPQKGKILGAPMYSIEHKQGPKQMTPNRPAVLEEPSIETYPA